MVCVVDPNMSNIFSRPTLLLQYTGILALGVGDAVVSSKSYSWAVLTCSRLQASVVGRRIGVHRWTPTTTKTLEGTLAFIISIVSFAWFLRLVGCAEPFSVRLTSWL